MKKLTRKAIADYLLHDCGLLAELTKYGKVHPIGSYRMAMMAWNDLDLDVENDSMSLEKLLQITAIPSSSRQPLCKNSRLLPLRKNSSVVGCILSRLIAVLTFTEQSRSWELQPRSSF